MTTPVSLFINQFSQAVKDGTELFSIVFPAAFVATGKDNKTTNVQGGVSVKREPKVLVECNSEIIASAIDVNIPEIYTKENFFELTNTLKVQTLFTREALVFTFKEDTKIIEMNFKFKETTGAFTNKKYVNVIFNKETNFICKAEILSNKYFNLYIWKAKEKNCIFSRHSLINLNSKKNKYLENHIYNYYYDFNGFPKLRQHIVLTKGVADVTNTVYDTEPITPCKEKEIRVPVCPEAPPKAARKLIF